MHKHLMVAALLLLTAISGNGGMAKIVKLRVRNLKHTHTHIRVNYTFCTLSSKRVHFRILSLPSL